uniref:hypothetical protein n=1 Tax=Agathobacter sp. TaxID=2021311 RepID=UPI0040564233
MIAGQVGKTNAKNLPVEILDEFEYQEDKSIMYLMNQIQEPVKNMNIKKITAAKVNTWLKEGGYLQEEVIPETGRTRKVPTEKGKSIGIYIKEREYEGRIYQSVLFDKYAQEFVVEMLRQYLQLQE